jgi:hypothetical protein
LTGMATYFLMGRKSALCIFLLSQQIIHSIHYLLFPVLFP